QLPSQSAVTGVVDQVDCDRQTSNFLYQQQSGFIATATAQRIATISRSRSSSALVNCDIKAATFASLSATSVSALNRCQQATTGKQQSIDVLHVQQQHVQQLTTYAAKTSTIVSSSNKE